MCCRWEWGTCCRAAQWIRLDSSFAENRIGCLLAPAPWLCLVAIAACRVQWLWEGPAAGFSRVRMRKERQIMSMLDHALVSLHHKHRLISEPSDTPDSDHRPLEVTLRVHRLGCAAGGRAGPTATVDPPHAQHHHHHHDYTNLSSRCYVYLLPPCIALLCLAPASASVYG